MPVDPPRNSSARRTFRKLSAEEEIEIRRTRGEVSCAECRRLKLKCDKKLPCSSCVRRGCQTICPNGSLSTGQGTRFVLADTEHLHRKIAEMGQRIRQLEDALAIFQASVSNECHPLLREEFLSIKFGPEIQAASTHESTQASDHPIDALGTLAITDNGENYYGRSAGSETLLLTGVEHETEIDDEIHSTSPMSPEILRLSKLFPFVTGGAWHSEDSMDMLLELLPSQPRAWSLCETYLEQASWSFRPIKRDEYIDEVLTPIYKYVRERKSSKHPPPRVSPHKLAVLFMVFSLGALVDLTLPAYSIEAENYFQSGRAALALRSIFENPEVATVQAVVLMAAYHSLAEKDHAMDRAWSLISLGSKLAQSIGLHRDSARWNLDPKTVQRRRSLFWEIFTFDHFHSLAIGRPPSIKLSYVDCEFPEDEEQSLNKNGQTEMGFWAWKYSFSKEVFSYATELTLTAAPPTYETVLELDRKVRQKTLPASLNLYFNPDEEYTPSVYMQGCLLSQYRSVAMLYIHRCFFAQAMLDHPINPLRSPFAPSFLAAYRCSSVIIKFSTNHFRRFPDLCMRWWTIWTHLFSAAIIVGSIVTRAPSSTMAPNAFIELGLAVDLFQKGSKMSRRARDGLIILSRLRDKAVQVYSQYRSGNTSVNPDLRLASKTKNEEEDELAIFGGQTRVLFSKLVSRRSKSLSRTMRNSSQPTTPSSSLGESQASSPGTDSIADVHPSLVEYLTLFPLSIFTPGASSGEVASGSVASMDTSSFIHLPTVSPPGVQLSPHNYLNSPYDNIFNPFGVQPLPHDLVPTPEPSVDPPMDFGAVMPGESHMDEQWLSFMRDSGFLDDRDNGISHS